MNTFIIGGNNVINSQVAQLSQQVNTTIVQGDFGALAKALEALGIAESDIADLKRATDEDAAKPEAGLGKKTSSWLSKLAARMGGAGWTVGTAAGVEIVTQLILKYLGGLAISANACAPRSDRVGLTTSGESKLEKADDVASAVRGGFGLMTFGTALRPRSRPVSAQHGVGRQQRPKERLPVRASANLKPIDFVAGQFAITDGKIEGWASPQLYHVCQPAETGANRPLRINSPQK